MAGDTVDRIKERIDIVDLIGSRVQLKRSGRYFKGLCPFHQEKTPSFVVYPDSQHYHCYGCGKNGDIFTFVMEADHLDFRDALERLAQRAGVEITRGSTSPSPQDARRQYLIDLNDRAAAYYSSVLWSSERAEAARGILEQRGIDRETAERFGLGFAPDSWDALKNHLHQRANASEQDLVEAGLCSISDNGRVFDRFRGRLMFPIRNRRGQVIGFGARALGDETPKYLNSPQTSIFNKSEALYAIDLAHRSIRQERSIIVVEGYMDAIAAHQHGFQNTVASMGTALTQPQVEAVRRYVDRVFVALDSDAAGQLATLRAIDTLRESFATEEDVEVDARRLIRFERRLDAEVRIVVLPEGKDPDDLIRSNIELWNAALDDAVPLVEFVLNRRLSDIEDSPAARAKALREIAVPLLREIGDPVIQSEYIDLVARLLRYKDRDVRLAINERQSPQRPATPAWSPNRPKAHDPERHLVALLVSYPLAAAVRNETLFQVRLDDIVDSRHRRLVDEIVSNNGDREAAFSALPDEIRDFAIQLRSGTHVRKDLSPGLASTEIEQAIQALATQRYEQRVRQVQDDIQEAKRSGDTETLREALNRMSQLASDKPRFAPRVSPYFKDLRTPTGS